MRRIMTLVVVALVMVAMMVAMAMPGLAKEKEKYVCEGYNGGDVITNKNVKEYEEAFGPCMKIKD
jgi:hypothetical protein